jgi:hypothetical protein
MSYSPLYHQEFMWVAIYNDDSILREWDEDGKVHNFNEIKQTQLKTFHLISAEKDYFFDCKNGIFSIDGREFIFPLSGMELPFGEGLIQFKEASTEFVPAVLKESAYDGFEIESHNFGWKATNDKLKVQVIFTLPERIFTVEMTMLDLYKTVQWKVKI